MSIRDATWSEAREHVAATLERLTVISRLTVNDEIELISLQSLSKRYGFGIAVIHNMIKRGGGSCITIRSEGEGGKISPQYWIRKPVWLAVLQRLESGEEQPKRRRAA